MYDVRAVQINLSSTEIDVFDGYEWNKLENNDKSEYIISDKSKRNKRNKIESLNDYESKFLSMSKEIGQMMIKHVQVLYKKLKL